MSDLCHRSEFATMATGDDDNDNDEEDGVTILM